jgi:hypothetical protein
VAARVALGVSLLLLTAHLTLGHPPDLLRPWQW